MIIYLGNSCQFSLICTLREIEESKKVGKDQKSIQSSTTPDPDLCHLSYFFSDRAKAVLLLWIIFVIICFVFAMLSRLFTCSPLVVTCLERANLLALLCIMFNCIFGTFPCGVQGQVWYFTVSIPDLCLLSYFVCLFCSSKRFDFKCYFDV